jgi:hypothetical protein
MAQKSKQGKFVNLEDVRVSYKPKDDTIHVTSGDSDIPNGSFYLTLNRGTPTEVALRQLLIKNGLIHVSEGQDGTSEALSVFSRQVASPVNDILLETLSGSPRNVWVQGSPGSGKSVSLVRVIRSSSLMNMTSLVVDLRADIPEMARRAGIEFVEKRLEYLRAGDLNPFYTTDNREVNHSIVLDVIENLVPTTIGQDVKDLLSPLISMCQAGEDASLTQLKKLCIEQDNPILVQIGNALHTTSREEWSPVLFAELPKQRQRSFFIENETVIITGARLSRLPTDNAGESTYDLMSNPAVRVDSSIVYMVNQTILSEMKADDKAKLLVYENIFGRGNKQSQVYLNKAILKNAEKTNTTIFAAGNDDGEKFLQDSFTDRFLFRSTQPGMNSNHELTSSLSSGEMIWEHGDELKFVPTINNTKEFWANTNPVRKQRGEKTAAVASYYGV